MLRVLRTSLIPCLLFGIPVGAVAAQDKDLNNPKKWPVVLKGEHYQLWSSAPEKESAEMLKFMELVFTTYTQLLDLPRPPVQKMRLGYFSSVHQRTWSSQWTPQSPSVPLA